MNECIAFEAWPSTPRLFREMVVTEKIDGTNAAIFIGDSGEFACQSRKQLITPDRDNHGFAAWAFKMREELTAFLGPGRHFGEWWGCGIQRGYGMRSKQLSLFNVGRWDKLDTDLGAWPDGLDVVPTLYTGLFDTDDIHDIKVRLRKNGSQAAPGYMDPEGIVVWHQAARVKFKSTYDDFDMAGGKAWVASASK